jgi:signal transduction histidine kinase
MEAQEQERRRVGRELHDHVGQELTAALLALKLIGADIRDGDHATALHEVAALRELLADTLQGVRALSSLLAPPAIDKHGFRGALERLARMLGERAGLEVRVEADAGADAMPEDLAAELYRIAQGGLTNVVRHAEARSVAVRVARTDAETLVMTVEDDGRGFDPDVPFGVGLEGASERVKLLGGEIHMEPRRGGGTVLRAELPWQD